MHDESGIEHEKLWLERFGLSYYGRCESLDDKIGILRKIKNLRKISISPWANIDNAVSNIGRDYVISLKPSPAIFTTENWDIEDARKELKKKLERAKGYNIEIIMKDISTVKHDPKRLWGWAMMASDFYIGKHGLSW